MTIAAEAGTYVVEAIANPGRDWDGFVLGWPGSTFCHRAGWAKVLADALGARPHFLEARDEDGRLAAVLPLFRVKSAILGDYLVSVPFLNYGGALGVEPARTLLAERAVELGRSLGVDAVELRARSREASSLTAIDRKITVEMPLPDDADVLWQALPSKLRSQVRRPMKEGMTARAGLAELGGFYDVFATNMRDLGTPVLPCRFFEAAAAEFPGEMDALGVYHEGRVVAAGCGFFHGDEFEITWASSLREVNRFAPNMLLYWELMRRAIERGARRFNFGRCTPGGGTHRFKKQWGGADVPLGWSTWAPSANAAPPNPDKPIFRLATSVWSRMPLWLANRLGPLVSRNLP